MNLYSSYAIGLTAIAAAYFGVNIAIDLYKARKKNSGTDVELFKLDERPAVATPVTEDGNGFVVVDADENETPENRTDETPASNDETNKEDSSSTPSKAEKRVESITENFVEGDTQSEYALNEVELRELLVNRGANGPLISRPDVPIERHIF